MAYTLNLHLLLGVNVCACIQNDFKCGQAVERMVWNRWLKHPDRQKDKCSDRHADRLACQTLPSN